MQFCSFRQLNSIAFGGLLFLLSSGFSLIFGLMRMPNLAHGAFFMLGAYFGATFKNWGLNFWLAGILAGLTVGVLPHHSGARPATQARGQCAGPGAGDAGVSFIIADVCLMSGPATPSRSRPAMGAAADLLPRLCLSTLFCLWCGHRGDCGGAPLYPHGAHPASAP